MSEIYVSPSVFEHTEIDIRKVIAEMIRLKAAFEKAQRETRAFNAALRGQHQLAQVILAEPGRQIVRAGMPEILHWLKECQCYTTCEIARSNP